jgi:cytochrome oxidase assembly protein ShyY1
MKAMKIKRFFQGALVFLLVASFIQLGLWQMHRASDLKAAQAQAATIDSKIYALEDLAAPALALDSRSVGKIVKVQGHYIANFKAPNQIDKAGKRSDWEVALLQVGVTESNQSAILVLRGLWSERLLNPDVAQANLVTVQGIVQPHQNEDVAENSPSQISRLDSSVITSYTKVDLYDGFIAAKSESIAGSALERTRVVVPAPISKVAGYYWQHISYVVIWWLMAAISLFAPFYRRKTIQ